MDEEKKKAEEGERIRLEEQNNIKRKEITEKMTKIKMVKPLVTVMGV